MELATVLAMTILSEINVPTRMKPLIGNKVATHAPKVRKRRILSWHQINVLLCPQGILQNRTKKMNVATISSIEMDSRASCKESILSTQSKPYSWLNPTRSMYPIPRHFITWILRTKE